MHQVRLRGTSSRPNKREKEEEFAADIFAFSVIQPPSWKSRVVVEKILKTHELLVVGSFILRCWCPVWFPGFTRGFSARWA